MSPKSYIDICKINEAKRLLTETELTISEVANSMGFSNISDFSKFFKNKVGLSPQAYLEEALKQLEYFKIRQTYIKYEYFKKSNSFAQYLYRKADGDQYETTY